MPYVKIEMLAGRSESQKAEIARAVTEALVTHGGATPASVSIVFADVPADHWAIGGQLLSARRS